MAPRAQATTIIRAVCLGADAQGLALGDEGAVAAHATVPLGEHATKIYEAFVEAGNGSKDFGAIYTTL